MAIAPADSCLHDDEQEQMHTMSLGDLLMVDNDDDDDDDDDLKKAFHARVAALQEEDGDDVLSAEAWAWAEGVEAVARRVAEETTQELEDIQRALSSPSQSSGEEDEAAAALRADAARVGALRADAEEIAATVRGLMEADLRRLAADAETGRYDYILTLTHEQLTVAARFQDLAVSMGEWMATLAARLTRGAAEFADTAGEEAFVAAMRKEAAKAEDARSAIARYRVAAGGSRQAPAAGDQTEEASCPAQS